MMDSITQTVERIKNMEGKYDKALQAVANVDAALAQFEAVIPEIEALLAYYESELWRGDYEMDEEGQLPKELKRGVLSEDGLYNLLTDYQRIKEML